MSQNKSEDRVLMILGKKNLNDRTYEDNENLREVIADYNERANLFGGFGEIGYPENFEISLSNVSHSVKNVRIEGNTVIGTVELLDTKAGHLLEPDFEKKVFRPRAVGKVNEDSTVILEKIFAFDAVDKETDSFKDVL